MLKLDDLGENSRMSTGHHSVKTGLTTSVKEESNKELSNVVKQAFINTLNMVISVLC